MLVERGVACSECRDNFALVRLVVSLILNLLVSTTIVRMFIADRHISHVRATNSRVRSSTMFNLRTVRRRLELTGLNGGNIPLGSGATSNKMMLATDGAPGTTIGLVAGGSLDNNCLAHDSAVSESKDNDGG